MRCKYSNGRERQRERWKCRSVEKFNQVPAEGTTLLKDRAVHFSAAAGPAWLRHLGQISPCRPHYITKNRRHFHYESDGGRRARVYRGRGGCSHCWEWAFRPHLLFIVNFLPHNHPKMQTDCHKIKQKINWPGGRGDAGVCRTPGWSALVFFSNLLCTHGWARGGPERRHMRAMMGNTGVKWRRWRRGGRDERRRGVADVEVLRGKSERKAGRRNGEVAFSSLFFFFFFFFTSDPLARAEYLRSHQCSWPH